MTDVGRRNLQSFSGDDFIMLDSMRENSRPSRLTLCTRDGILTGFQVWYGEYDEIAGSAHGDLSTDCQNSLINQEIWKVNMYGSSGSGAPYIEGIEFELQPFRDESFPGQTISAGLVGQAGQKKRSLLVPNKGQSANAGNVFHFFGFKTDSRAGVITNIKVITYDPEAVFRSRFNF